MSALRFEEAELSFDEGPVDLWEDLLRERVSERWKGIFDSNGRSTGADAHI